MSEHLLLIISEDGKEYARKLTKLSLPELTIQQADSPEEIRTLVSRADIVLGEPWSIQAYLSDAGPLKWIQTTSVGVDALVKQGARRDYILTNARGILGPKLTEYTFGHILTYKKRILENYEQQKQKKWDPVYTDSLTGETIVILGTGSIGAHIATVAKAFGLRTVGYRTKKEPVDNFDEIYGADELAVALSKGDYVVSVLPGTAATNSMIRSETIAHMKNGVVFVNIGRGNAVVEDDVVEAVRSGKIARAILDVFRKEPLSQDSPLWITENVTVTPHIAGYAGTDALVKLFATNYELFLVGADLLHQVDFKKGY